MWVNWRKKRLDGIKSQNFDWLKHMMKNANNLNLAPDNLSNWNNVNQKSKDISSKWPLAEFWWKLISQPSRLLSSTINGFIFDFPTFWSIIWLFSIDYSSKRIPLFKSYYFSCDPNIFFSFSLDPFSFYFELERLGFSAGGSFDSTFLFEGYRDFWYLLQSIDFRFPFSEWVLDPD